MYKLDLEKAKEPEIKLGTSSESQKKQGNTKNKNKQTKSTSASFSMIKPLTVWSTTNLWKIFKETGIPDHLTCHLRSLYAGQEATVKTRHGTTDWFQIGKGVQQGYILSSCLFICRVHHAKCQAE